MEYELKMESSGLTHWRLVGDSLQGNCSPKPLVKSHQLGPSRWDPVSLCFGGQSSTEAQKWTLGQEKKLQKAEANGLGLFKIKNVAKDTLHDDRSKNFLFY